MGWEGTVLLRVKVNSQGRADVIRLARSSGYSPLDEAAQEAVARWRFEPAREGEQAVSAWAEVPLVFQLHAS
jgi:protein TonB